MEHNITTTRETRLTGSDESTEKGVRVYEDFEKIKYLETKIATATMILGHTLFLMREQLNQETIGILWQSIIDKSTDFAQELHDIKIKESNGN